MNQTTSVHMNKVVIIFKEHKAGYMPIQCKYNELEHQLTGENMIEVRFPLGMRTKRENVLKKLGYKLLGDYTNYNEATEKHHSVKQIWVTA